MLHQVSPGSYTQHCGEAKDPTPAQHTAIKIWANHKGPTLADGSPGHMPATPHHWPLAPKLNPNKALGMAQGSLCMSVLHTGPGTQQIHASEGL